MVERADEADQRRRTLPMVTVLGLALIAVAAVLLLADSGHLSQRMPTQVPPRGLALLPLVAGVVLLLVGLGSL